MSALLEWTGSVCVCGNVYSHVCVCMHVCWVSPLHIHSGAFVLFSYHLFLSSPNLALLLSSSPAHRSVHPSLLSVQFRILPLPPQHWSPTLLSDPPAGTVFEQLRRHLWLFCTFPGIHVDTNPGELRFFANLWSDRYIMAWNWQHCLNIAVISLNVSRVCPRFSLALKTKS